MIYYSFIPDKIIKDANSFLSTNKSKIPLVPKEITSLAEELLAKAFAGCFPGNAIPKLVELIFDDAFLRLHDFTQTHLPQTFYEAQTAKRKWSYNRSAQTLNKELSELYNSSYSYYNWAFFLASNILATNSRSFYVSSYGGPAIIAYLNLKSEHFSYPYVSNSGLSDFIADYQRYISYITEVADHLNAEAKKTDSLPVEYLFFNLEKYWKLNYLHQILEMFTKYEPHLVFLKNKPYKDRLPYEIVQKEKTREAQIDFSIDSELYEVPQRKKIPLSLMNAYELSDIFKILYGLPISSENYLTNLYISQIILSKDVELLMVNPSVILHTAYEVIPNIQNLIFCYALKECLQKDLNGNDLRAQLDSWSYTRAKEILKDNFSIHQLCGKTLHVDSDIEANIKSCFFQFVTEVFLTPTIQDPIQLAKISAQKQAYDSVFDSHIFHADMFKNN